MEIRIIGIDCATLPEKTGLAKCILNLTTKTLALECVQTGSKNRSIAQKLYDESWIEPEIDTLIAIDAPLGWPASLGEALFKHKAGNYIRGEANNLFRRETDRFIKRQLGKQSLDVGADRIARTAHAALRILKKLRDGGQDIPLAWDWENLSGVHAIEVYPAATLKAYGMRYEGYKGDKKGEERKEIVEDLKKRMEIPAHLLQNLYDSDDVLDAAVCCLAEADFLLDKSMKPEEQELAEKEGWIWVKHPNSNQMLLPCL